MIYGSLKGSLPYCRVFIDKRVDKRGEEKKKKFELCKENLEEKMAGGAAGLTLTALGLLRARLVGDHFTP